MHSRGHLRSANKYQGREKMVRFNGVNHLAMATGDMDKTIRFWRDLLGMRLVAGLGQPGYRHYFFQISDSDLIAFFEWPGVEPVLKKDHGRPVRGPFIFDHVSFRMASIDFSCNVREINIRKEPQLRYRAPSQSALEGAEPRLQLWPRLESPTPASERVVYPAAGSDLFHGKKKS
jgi:catechol 2,3-dioxygenase-like lactoylglutathione lyase family enzyme